MIAVGFGAFFGAIARYTLSNLIHRYNTSAFPWATFFVNCVGCFFIGITMHFTAHQPFYLVAAVGFLGAFTTFSTFSLETIQLIEKKKYMIAALYVLLTLITGLLLTYSGLLLFNK